MEPDDTFLLGTDLLKGRDRLVAAYNDSRGVTAAFNRNALVAINAAYDGNFDDDAFEHVAVFNETHHWIEMRLRSRLPQRVVLRGLGLAFDLEEGEEIRTEISTKFSPNDIEAEFRAAGFRVIRAFRDPADDFQLTLGRL
jgi:L-histidine N-alpha-methyltransferase